MKIYKTVFTILLLLIAVFTAACGSNTAPEAAAPPANEMETMSDTKMEDMNVGEMENMADDAGDGEMADMEMEGMTDGEMDNMDMSDEIPADLDTSFSRPTEQGLYQVTISSELEPLNLNEIHNWTIHIETPDGTAVENAEIKVNGEMPVHQHGFPTTPQVTENLGNGDYKLEGVKFNMAGWWEIRLDISADGQSDSVTFNIILP